MDNLLDENAISDNLFPVVLEYFEGCKGMAREVLLRKGMEIIKKTEEEMDEDDKKEIMKSDYIWKFIFNRCLIIIFDSVFEYS